jgi:MoxR-like ATPase
MSDLVLPEPPPHALRDRLRALRDALGAGLVEREMPLRLALLAALAGEHLLLLGPPGTAKSLLARRLRLAFRDAALFERLLTRFSVPEELFGPLSLRALEDDRYERATAGFLPTAHVAFLDEVFKANSAILNALLTLLNEREFDNGTVRQKTPLVAVIAASNELPEGEELDALFDRFLVRCHVGPVSDEGFDRLLDLGGASEPTIDPAGTFSAEELASLRAAAARVPLGNEARQLLRDARVFHRSREIPVSDRRFRKIVGLLQMSAFTHGRSEVSLWDCALLVHATWDAPAREAEVRDFYASRIGVGGREGEELPRLLAALEGRLEEDRTSQTQARDTEGRPLYGERTGPSSPPQITAVGRRQRRSAAGEALFLRPAAWGVDRTNGGQGYTEGELDFDHRSRSFRAWDERERYLADASSWFLEETSLPPLLEPTRFSRAHVAAAVHDAEELRAALAKHRDGLARLLEGVPRDVRSHLWIEPSLADVATTRLTDRLAQVDAALARCEALVEAAEALPLREP